MIDIKEIPILFSGEMVRAILEGHKTQTRRTVKAKHLPFLTDLVGGLFDGKWNQRPLPYGKNGDRLWVKETFWSKTSKPSAFQSGPNGSGFRDATLSAMTHSFTAYRANWGDKKPDGCDKWKPSIFMPRALSRILLENTAVRVERLQDISEEDARSEGITDGGCVNCGNPEPCGCDKPSPDARDSFARLWESINGVGSWALNPWVWVIEFKQVKL